jgi:hypothetical protein
MRSGVSNGLGGIGSRERAILRTVHGGQWFDCDGRNGPYRACMRLEARRLLTRDPQNRWRFTSTAAGDALIEDHDAALEAAT